MFSLKFNALPNTDAILYWHEARSKVYKTFAEYYNIQTNEVYFDFSAPEAGWADISVYCDGNKKLTFPISAAFDPFTDIKAWMEDIVNDFKLSSDVCIDAEGRTVILHYEHLRLAEHGAERKFVHADRDQDEWQSYDAMSCPDLGLFYIYDSDSMDIPAVCCCETKQFLFALYHAMLEFARNRRHDIAQEWYYMDNGERDRRDLYNIIKSPMIEWGIYSDHAYRHLRPAFNKRETIQETIHMWAEWGDALFWKNGCCGNAECINLSVAPYKIDLISIEGLREWYDEFDNQDPMKDRPDDEYYDWLTRGWDFALKIRQLLPPHVELFYEWRGFKAVDAEYGWAKELARVVPDIRDIDERSRNRMTFKLY